MEAMKPKSGIGVLGSQPQSGVRKPRVIVCVTGGRLPFSGVEVARGLVSLGCDVQIVLTMEAAESVTPSAAETFTNQKPVVDPLCGAGFNQDGSSTTEQSAMPSHLCPDSFRRHSPGRKTAHGTSVLTGASSRTV